MALEWMEEFKVSHLAVADGTRFIGIISEDVVVDENNLDLPMSRYEGGLVDIHVSPDQHIYDVIRTLSGRELSIMPVVDADGTYIGCITMPDLLNKFDELAVVNQPGGILVVEMGMRDYSLAQVAHIVESNGAKILSSYIFQKSDNDKMELTLKIDREYQTPVIQALERYGYSVAGSFHGTDEPDDIKDRYDALMRYINI